MLRNPYFQSLVTGHKGIAIGAGAARRFPADVIPFAGVAEETPAAMAALRELLTAGESMYVTGDVLPKCAGLEQIGALPGVQMIFAGTAPEVEVADGPGIETMDAGDAEAMVALTDVAFPGFFRARTYVLGSYYGIRVEGELVAMAGERLAIAQGPQKFCEVSAVCTHPKHRGQGYAPRLIRHILREHAAKGIQSFLHATAENPAVRLYERLGFVKTGDILFNRLQRV